MEKEEVLQPISIGISDLVSYVKEYLTDYWKTLQEEFNVDDKLFILPMSSYCLAMIGFRRNLCDHEELFALYTKAKASQDAKAVECVQEITKQMEE